MITSMQIIAECGRHLVNATHRGHNANVELYDKNYRASAALHAFKLNAERYYSLGPKYNEYALRVEKDILRMQSEPLDFPMTLPDRSAWCKVQTHVALQSAYDAGYRWDNLRASDCAKLQNPCMELAISSQPYATGGYIHSPTGSPYPSLLTKTQQAYIGRAAWRYLFKGSQDAVVIECLPHVKLSQTVAARLRKHCMVTDFEEIVWAFYNQSRNANWWVKLRSYSMLLRDRANQNLFAYLVADYIHDALGPQEGLDGKFKTGDVMALTRHIRATEDFSLMPILADALMDAGYNNTKGVLTHYRDPDGRFSLGSWIFRACGL